MHAHTYRVKFHCNHGIWRYMKTPWKGGNDNNSCCAFLYFVQFWLTLNLFRPFYNFCALIAHAGLCHKAMKCRKIKYSYVSILLFFFYWKCLGFSREKVITACHVSLLLGLYLDNFSLDLLASAIWYVCHCCIPYTNICSTLFPLLSFHVPFSICPPEPLVAHLQLLNPVICQMFIVILFKLSPCYSFLLSLSLIFTRLREIATLHEHDSAGVSCLQVKGKHWINYYSCDYFQLIIFFCN